MFIIRFLDNCHHQYGPFASAKAASEWAIKNINGKAWVIQKLFAPGKIK